MADSQALQESQNLSMFLATQGKIRDTRKEYLEKIRNYEELFCDIVNTAITMYENKSYLTPAEKHTLVKVNIKDLSKFSRKNLSIVNSDAWLQIFRVINLILLTTFKVMGFSLFLIDSEQANLNKLDRKGLLHLGRIDKVEYSYKRMIGTLVYE